MNRITTLSIAVASFIATMLISPAAVAQDEREMLELRERAAQLLREAEELDARGRERAAAEARARAEELIGAMHERERARDERHAWRREAIERLELAMEALDRLERHDARDLLARIADAIRRESDRPLTDRRPERPEANERLHRELDALRMAAPMLAQDDRREVRAMLERAIHVRELAIEGRPEALAEGPPPRRIARILALAESVYRDHGAHDRADMLAELSAELFAREAGQRRPAGQPTPEDVEAMEIAIHGLLEAERMEAANALRRSLQSLERQRTGRGRRVMDEPSPEERRELLGMAAAIWLELDRPEEADRVRALIDRLDRPQRSRVDRPRGDAPDRAAQLERRLDELQRALEELREEIARLRRR
jgi:hypothetical protein